jgi:hypothetical protein
VSLPFPRLSSLQGLIAAAPPPFYSSSMSLPLPSFRQQPAKDDGLRPNGSRVHFACASHTQKFAVARQANAIKSQKKGKRKMRRRAHAQRGNSHHLMHGLGQLNLYKFFFLFYVNIYAFFCCFDSLTYGPSF